MLSIRSLLFSRQKSRKLQLLGFFLATRVFSTVIAEPASAQQAPLPPQSMAEAARNSRDLKKYAAHPHKIITNEDLAPRPAVPPPPDRHFLDSLSYAQVLPPTAPNCDTHPAALRLKSDIEAAQSDLESLRRQASVPQFVISGHNLDPQYFKPGASGLDLGAPALLEDRAPIDSRVDAVPVEERIDRLQKLLRAVCEPPAAARLQLELDTAEQDLGLALRALALDQANFYGQPDFTSDADGRQRIQAEQEHVQELQAEVDRLKAELAAHLAQDLVS